MIRSDISNAYFLRETKIIDSKDIENTVYICLGDFDGCINLAALSNKQ